jgi:tetratricopeptide (TPR) repeat protein
MNEHQFSQLLDKAQYYEEHHEWLHAAQYYLRILRAEPGLADVAVRLSGVYAEMGNLAAAEQALLNAVGRDHGNPDLLFALGRLFYRADDLDKALYYFEQLIPYRLPQAHHTIGLIQYQKANFVKAERHLLRAFELDPGIGGVHTILAETLLKNGKPQQAIEVLREAQRLQPGDWQSGYLLGVAHASAKQWTQALEAFMLLLLVRPDDIDALCAASSVLVQVREMGTAEEYLRKAQSLAPRSPVVLNHLGSFALMKADRAKARACFAEVLEIDPSNATALEHLRLLETASR